MTKKENIKTETTEQTQLPSRKTLLIVIAAILILLVGLLAWLYTGRLTSAKQYLFSKLPLPVALVQFQPIFGQELFQRVSLARELLSESNQLPTDLTGEILTQLIETKKIEALAKRYNVQASSEDIEQAYQSVIKQLPNQREQELVDELQKMYGMSLSSFKNDVLRQSATKENLSLWHNSQEALNSEAYVQARDLLKQLDQGADFEDVARKYNQDPASQAFAGDSGFVNYSDLLPEFQKAVSNLAINDNQLVASRYGIHVLKVSAIEEEASGTGESEKSYNLQQIFIAPADFNAWLQSQFTSINSIKFL